MNDQKIFYISPNEHRIYSSNLGYNLWVSPKGSGKHYLGKLAANSWCLNWTYFVGEVSEGVFLVSDSIVSSYLSDI